MSSSKEDISLGGGKFGQPPLMPSKVSMSHFMRHVSQSRYFASRMWKLKEPQGSQTLIAEITFFDGVEIITRGEYSPPLYRKRGTVRP